MNNCNEHSADVIDPERQLLVTSPTPFTALVLTTMAVSSLSGALSARILGMGSIEETWKFVCIAVSAICAVGALRYGALPWATHLLRRHPLSLASSALYLGSALVFVGLLVRSINTWLSQ